jgi:1-acyl-sn-glycerol-3-phosphate acyltransferase
MLKVGCRRLWRFGRFLDACAQAGIDSPKPNPGDRAAWTWRHARRFAAAVGMQVMIEGDPGDAEAWVGNHLGYLDIVGLGTVRPAAFVSKADVRRWPIIGGLASRSGAVFLERERRMAVGHAVAAMSERVAAGVPVIFFPEGTSSGGGSVLPFHASLFGPAVERGWRLAPFALGFETVSDGGAEPTYWGDMTFGPHFVRLLGHGGLRMRIRFGEVVRVEKDRKEAALVWRERVAALHAGIVRGGLPGENGLRHGDVPA